MAQRTVVICDNCQRELEPSAGGESAVLLEVARLDPHTLDGKRDGWPPHKVHMQQAAAKKAHLCLACTPAIVLSILERA